VRQDAVDAGVDQPAHLGGHRVVVDIQLSVEVSHDRGIHALHFWPPLVARAGSKALSSSSRPPSSSIAANSSPVNGASVIPSVACAVARCTPSNPGTGPM